MESTEFETKKTLEDKRKKIESFDDLIAFLEDVKNNYNIGYGDSPRAIAQAALATAWFLSREFGITGFQASCAMFDFIRGWIYVGNKTGLKIIDYDKMLYPQYEYAFDKKIPDHVWESLQKEANELLCKEKWRAGRDIPSHQDVVRHWQSIVDGDVPFGYMVEDNR